MALTDPAGGSPLEFTAEQLFDEAPCGYLTLGQNGCILRANKRFADWTGYHLADLPGRTFQSLLSKPGQIYFETHFNLLLAENATPRSLRRRNLELGLEAREVAEDDRRLERAIWADMESDHLRSTRVLKSRFNQNHLKPKVATAGYQVVRILGKGSFGVVRLVREAKET